MGCILIAASCHKATTEKLFPNTVQIIDLSKKSVVEIDTAFALWYSYQDEALIAARPFLRQEFGPVNNGVDPSDTIAFQRKALRAIKSATDAGNPESVAAFERWLDCHAQAANSLADLLSKDQQGDKITDPERLLNHQDEIITLLKAELRRRGRDYWMK